ncbi:MAG TPA: chemotaxis protein CheW [Candidatus Nanopelagicales bacterium]|nr:chemotaxis protein CheW [Candidatus Nanopelagicales bacterium]
MTSLFTAAPARPVAPAPAPLAPVPSAREADADVPAGFPVTTEEPDGYVVFAVGATSYAVPVEEVGSVLRPDHLELLASPERPRYGRGVALVDVRGRAIPVVDLRADTGRPGEVLLPLYRHHVGLVVDRVVAVRAARELEPEPDGLPDVLPEWARGVLRPIDGGPHLLLVAMPDAAALIPRT